MGKYGWLILVIIIGCKKYTPPKAIGGVDEIIVIGRKEVYQMVEEELKITLERVAYYPTKEYIFDLQWGGVWEFWRKFKYYKNCIIVGIVGEDIIDSLLEVEEKERVMKGEEYLFVKEDYLLPGQSLMVIVGPTLYKIKEVVRGSMDFIYTYFFRNAKKRIKTTLYKDGYRKKYYEMLQKKYSFSLYIPHGWDLVYFDSCFVKILRHFPDRVLSIYWEDSSAQQLSKEYAIKLREKLGKIYFEGDFVLDTLLYVSKAALHGFEGIKLCGIWQNEEKVMGGPFRSYMFFGEGKLYFIDLHVFAPGEKKWFLLEQLEIIAKTFTLLTTLK